LVGLGFRIGWSALFGQEFLTAGDAEIQAKDSRHVMLNAGKV
jgi:hypothetical protein